MAIKEPKKYLHEELIKFTSQKEIGAGGFSKVYNGQLDGKKVAIKVLEDDVAESFEAEMKTMATASHPNLVTLYGYCSDSNMKALVYEFMENGSLDKILFYDHLSLEWGELYKIALGTAMGLAYLHDGCGKQIIHRDMKPANVLVDKDLSAKITDFGLAKLISTDACHYTITHQNKGTEGYTAPEFGCLASKITKKCDVYSFGVTLFEVLRKRRNQGRGEEWFPLQVWTKFKTGKLDQLIESFGIPETHKGKAKILSVVALWCSQYTVDLRPSMSDVVKVLMNETPAEMPPYPFMYYSPPHRRSMLHSVIPESPVISNRWFGIEELLLSESSESEPDAFKNAYQEEVKKGEAVKDSDDKQAISNFFEQVFSKESKTSSETQKLLSELETGQPQQFSRSDIKRFTSDFSEGIGNGGYGYVYKGQFLDGVEVVVKVLSKTSVNDETFMDVVKTKRVVYHPNIVKLYGYCFDGDMKALVYEYINYESLDIILYRNHHLDIEWKQLYEIVIETAKGLSVLHAAGIIHHDIKASNILLNSNLSPKIRIYGLKGLINIKKRDDDAATRIAGSRGYTSPDMLRPPSEVASKNDVYSFGMLLFEVLGRRNLSNQRCKGFPYQVWKMFKKGLIGKVIMDCGINKKNMKKAINLSKVALWCVQFDPQERPSMSSVVNMLEMEVPFMDPPRPFPKQQLQSASPSIEISSVISNPTLVAGRPHQFSCSDLITFTSEFSEILGTGGLGVVYKGKFLYGVEVAIKLLHDIDEIFMDEVMTMEMVYHPNIVKLHGYCFDGHMKALVPLILYRNHLHLKWEQLYKIATETAKGLSVLHAVGIIPNDIKASNILLNSNIWKKFEKGQLDLLIESFGIPETDKGKAKIISMVAFWCAQITGPYPFEIHSKASPVIHESLGTARPQPYSLSDLERFTSKFSEEIGRGGHGVVYKGQFLDGMEVAITVLHDKEVLEKINMDVVMTWAMVNHPNIVKIHGYCFDSHMKALVYEYFGNGSLDMILYRNHQWEQLYEIAIETAKGLSVLHAADIIHHDIKASNILLNSNHSPKIRSSGLGGLIIKTRNDDVTRIAGSYGYSSPETWIPTSEVTSKSDVYSFGMLLFEVLGRRCISNHRGKKWFPAQVWMMFDKGLLGELLEDCGINEKDRKKAYNLSKVALWCAQFDPQKRPSMSSVVKMLEIEIQVNDPPNPFPHELSFHEKGQSGGDRDKAVGLVLFLLFLVVFLFAASLSRSIAILGILLLLLYCGLIFCFN